MGKEGRGNEGPRAQMDHKPSTLSSKRVKRLKKVRETKDREPGWITRPPVLSYKRAKRLRKVK